MTTTTGKKELLAVTSVGALISEFLKDETNVLNGEAWAAMYANVMEKYELSDLERIADELRSFDPAVQLPGVTGPWKVVKVPEYEKETNEGLRKSMLVSWLCEADWHAPLVPMIGGVMAECRSLALLCQTSRVCGRTTCFDSVEKAVADLTQFAGGPMVRALDFVVTVAKFNMGGRSKERSTDQMSWGLYVEPNESEKEGTGSVKPAKGKGNIGDLHAFWEEDESEDENEVSEEESRAYQARVEALRTSKNSAKIDKVVQKLLSAQMTKKEFLSWLEQGEAVKAAKQSAGSGGSGLLGVLGGSGGGSGLGGVSGGLEEAIKKAVEAQFKNSALTCGVLGGSQSNHLLGGSMSRVATGQLGAMGGAGGQELKKIKEIQLRDSASVGLREKGNMRSLVMQEKTESIKREWDRLSEKVKAYPSGAGEFATKANLQLNVLWTILYKIAQLECDLQECLPEHATLQQTIVFQMESAGLEKGRTVEYLKRLDEAVGHYQQQGLLVAQEYIKVHEEKMKGEGMKDAMGEAMLKQAEKSALAKRKLAVQEKQWEALSGPGLSGVSLAAHYGQQHQMGPLLGFGIGGGSGGSGGLQPAGGMIQPVPKKPRGGESRADEFGVQGAYRKGGVLGERKGIEWVDAGVWRADLAGALAPKPGTFTTDRRYNFDTAWKGVQNPTNQGRLSCDICQQQGHAAAECGAGYTGQLMEFQRNGKRHLTWQFINKERLCNGFGRKKN